MILDVFKVSKNFGFGDVFSDISFSVDDGDVVGLVGRNGSGKSTILKMIAGKENFKGSITLAKNTTVGYLEQTAPDLDDDRVVEEIFKSCFEKLFERQKTIDKMAEKMATLSGNDLDKLINKYSDMLNEFIEDGGYEVENTINYVANGLRINENIRKAKYNTLSGGEKTIVHFARILLMSPRLLLLDEPTNHLDIDRIEWLQSYIQRFKGGVVIVSHDRYFLDKVVNRIIDIEDSGEKYEGNYSYFVKEKEAKELRQFEQYKNEQKKIAELKKAVERLYEWGRKSDNPTMFRRAKAIQKRIDAMEEVAVSKPNSRKELKLSCKTSNRGGNEVVKVKGLNVTYGDRNILNSINLDILHGEKLALIGKNGGGKTTLIKSLLGEIDYQGEIKIGSSITVGYLPQLLVFEKEKESILSYVTNNTELKEEGARRLLAKFDFYKDDVEKSVGKLSGGEKIRVKLACLLEKDINFLIIDEPTNHIDIYTREVLEEMLSKFKGTILFVSHDRYFINNLATGILELDNKKITKFGGNYDEYKGKDEVKIEKVEETKISRKPHISKGGKWS
ncbi:MAG: ABC-F family ATP-binding cassette domain-containing protein [Clostridiales bacterium]|nr:ABC-F family ATP-binding cassette domain-containing protein [Clostridiales bacterium]